MMRARKRYTAAGLVLIAALVLSGGALATHEPVPANEAGRLSPEQLRGLLSGRVQVTERLAGRFSGALLVRRFTEDGRWSGCVVDRMGKVWFQKTGSWNVAVDSRGRGKLFAMRKHRPGFHHHINPAVIHYDPETGHFLWRTWPLGHDRPKPPKEGKGGRWIDWNGGWFQEKWPQSAADKCPDLDLDGLEVDARQTGTTLEALREQTPDAPLKGLAESLPPVSRDAQ